MTDLWKFSAGDTIRLLPDTTPTHFFVKIWDVTCPAADPDCPKHDEEFRTISAWIDEQRGPKRVPCSLLESLEDSFVRRSMQDAMVFYQKQNAEWVIRCRTEEDAVTAKLRWCEGV